MDEVLTDEQIGELKKKAEEADSLKTQLEKLKSKDMNFDRFRKQTEEERAKFLDNLSSKERILYERLDELETQLSSKDEKILGAAKTQKIRELVGEDKDLTEKLENYAKKIKANPQTPEEINELYEDAYVMLQRRSGVKINPVNRAFAGSGQDNYRERRERGFGDTDEGKALAKSLGLDLEPPKK